MRIVLKDKNEFKYLIIIKGYSQRGFSRMIGLSEPYINQITNGERNPSPQTAKKITELLEIKFEDIFTTVNDHKSE